MDMLKKYFPFSFKSKDVKDLVINIVIYLVIRILGGWVLGLLGGDPQGKIRKMMEFAGSCADVADPWYTGSFDVTYRDIVKRCEGLLKALL